MRFGDMARPWSWTAPRKAGETDNAFRHVICTVRGLTECVAGRCSAAAAQRAGFVKHPHLLAVLTRYAPAVRPREPCQAWEQQVQQP